ncbi:hypothetical protein ZIOFF_062345 [Zingiber officinale]|uniref:ABC transmembrane type-1 domain-containing protein n=1 Tax=Zingiber officinale TaxID=94328 RepID=A0A8J5F4Z5_ZINOF|nr:hypothetical protein ZIOFF_062345 [Zingiber officinale]
MRALKDLNWVQVMHEEYDALLRNQTLTLVPPSLDQNLVGNRWVFCTKRNSNASIDRYKARLVAKGFHQRPGVDFHDTFSPIINPDGALIYFLVYVDDLIITGSDASSVDVIVCKHHAKFMIKDLGALSLFCGVEVHPTLNGLLLSQQKVSASSSSAHFAPRLGIFPMTTSSTASALILAIILLLVAPLSPGNCALNGEGNALFFSFGGSGKNRSFATEFALYGDAEMNSSEVRVTRAANESSGLMIYWKPVRFFGTKPRLNGVCKAPIIQHFSESLSGSTTIRSFDQNQRFINTNFNLSDQFSRPKFHTAAAMQWLCLRLDMLSSVVFAFSLLFLISMPRGVIDPGISGLAVTYGLNLNKYTTIDSEPPLSIESNKLYSSWPSNGEIELHNLQLWILSDDGLLLILSRGEKLHSWIDYDEESKRIEVRLCQDKDPKEAAPSISHSIDLSYMLWREASWIDAHIGSVNDISFSYPKKTLSIITYGDDKAIKFTNLKYSRVEIDEVRFEWAECMLDYI